MVDDVTPKQAWESLRRDPLAQLVDVRTEPEWTFTGLPELTETGKLPVLIPWQVYPSMQINAGFLDDLRNAGLEPAQRLIFMCRTGGRSRAAAEFAAANGYPNVANMVDGFEGVPDGAGHRGTVAGWKADGLPWRQK